jgi:RNA polymerase sigma factor (sigma-70 family)
MQRQASTTSCNGCKHLWERYASSQSDEDRNAIFERHWPLVCKRVKYILKKMGGERFGDDVLSHVSEWLLATVIPGSGGSRKFNLRISAGLRRRICDILRAEDRVPREKRLTRTDVSEASAELGHILGHHPNDGEIAHHLAISEQEVIAAMTGREVQADYPVACTDDRGFEELIHILPEYEKSLMRMYYIERKTLAELSEEFNIPKSTLFRWLSQAREEIKKNREI